jgi:predicted deacylase
MTIVAACARRVLPFLTMASPLAAQPTQTPVASAVASVAAVTCRDTLRSGAASLLDTCVRVPAGADGPELSIPVTIVEGGAPGPTLVVTAGIHGAEYAPIAAARRVRAAFAGGVVAPGRLRGRLVLVLLANPPAFAARSVYYVPADGRNLNRVFPGRADGTQSDRLAHALATAVLWGADAYVDLHAGDANEALVPHVYAPVTGDSAYDARAMTLARATGLVPVVLVRRARVLPPPGTVLSSTGYGAAAGIPTVATEAGELGATDTASVGAQTRAVFGVLRALDMLAATDVPRALRPAAPARGAAVTVAAVVDSTNSFAAATDGYWEAAVAAGTRVRAGTLLGVVSDAYGTTLQEVRAPNAGRVLYVTRTPPVRRGESLAYIAVERAAPPRRAPR